MSLEGKMYLTPPLTPTGGSCNASQYVEHSPCGLPVGSSCLNSASVRRFCRTPRPCLDSDSRSPRLINDAIDRHGTSGLVSKPQEEDSLTDIRCILMKHQADTMMQLNEWMTKHEECLQNAFGTVQEALDEIQCKMAHWFSIPVSSRSHQSADPLSSTGSNLLSVPQRLKRAATKASNNSGKTATSGSDSAYWPSIEDTQSVPSRQVSKYMSVEEMRLQSLYHTRSGSTNSSSFAKRHSPWQHLVETMHTVVNSFIFELIFGTLICVNSVILGVEVAMASSSPKEELPDLFYYLTIIFSSLFLVELVMRLLSEGGPLSFFIYSDFWAWNWFDMIAVMCSWIEVGFNFVLLGGGSQTVTRIMRVARMTRLGRVLRIIRIVRFVSQLRVLVISISTSLQTLCWALFLLLIIIYIFGVLLAQATAEHFSEYPGYDLENLGGNKERLAHYWGSLHAAMYTLFMSVAGGVSWEDVVLPIAEVHWIWAALFTSFIAFSSFSLINVMTAVFCQSAIESAQKTTDVKWQRMCADKRKHVVNLKRLFKSLDSKSTRGTVSPKKNCNTGTLSLRKLQECWDNVAMQQFLLSMDLAPDDCWTFFSVLDANLDKEVSAEEFVDGCLRLKGSSRAFDTAVTIYELRHLSKQSFSFMNDMQENLSILLRAVAEPTSPTYHSSASSKTCAQYTSTATSE